MSLNRASTPTSTTHLGVYNVGVFDTDYDNELQDPMEGNVSTAAANQPLEYRPNKSVRSSSTPQGRVRGGGHDDLETPAATRSSLRTPPSRNSERHTPTGSSFFSSSILTSICGYFGPMSLFSSGEDTDVATKKKHVRFSLTNKNGKSPTARRRLSFLLDGEEVPAKPKHRRSLARMSSMKDILFELDIHDFSVETPIDIPTLIVFERKKRKLSFPRRYASQLFFSPQRSRRRRPFNNMLVNQSF